MKKRTLNDLRQNKDSYYEHPYKTKGINIIELFKLPTKYTNDADLGKAFRVMMAEATDLNYNKK
tara:strand:- start:1079 stop:1270 length:192 start_codon:yes stop_codon:yes gene_type:complete